MIYQKRIVTQENRLQKLENERQQSLLRATIEGQERERERLAKDLLRQYFRNKTRHCFVGFRNAYYIRERNSFKNQNTS